MKKTLVVFRRFVGDEKLPEVYRGIILSRYIGIILSIGIYIEKKVMGIKGAKPPPMPSNTPQEIAGLIMWFLRDQGG